METCGCKGIRSCLICETDGRKSLVGKTKVPSTVYSYCEVCSKAFVDPDHQTHEGSQNMREYAGIFINKDFVSPEEEQNICEAIYRTPFVDSQSGRRKQDYGPKVNFKRKKLKMEVFSGLPSFSRTLYDRMRSLDCLQDFVPIEQCNLEYDPDRGSAIDPHFDDFWLWGERLVTLNLKSDSVLYMTSDYEPGVEVHVPLIRRSLLVLYGDARHKWKHGIQREDIKGTRIAITYRELSQEFQSGGARETDGEDLVRTALSFTGTAVGS